MGEAKQRSDWVTHIAIAAAILLIDQLTKWCAAHLTAPIALTTFFSFAFSTNAGAGFSTFQRYPGILTLVATIAVIGIPWYYRKAEEKFRLPLALIWAGAAGNLLDRLFLGAVRDFIAFSFWPSFNVADSAITIGVLLALWVEWRK